MHYGGSQFLSSYVKTQGRYFWTLRSQIMWLRYTASKAQMLGIGFHSKICYRDGTTRWQISWLKVTKYSMCGLTVRWPGNSYSMRTTISMKPTRCQSCWKTGWGNSVRTILTMDRFWRCYSMTRVKLSIQLRRVLETILTSKIIWHLKRSRSSNKR